MRPNNNSDSGRIDTMDCEFQEITECSMARERSVAGVSDTIPACVVHGEYIGE